MKLSRLLLVLGLAITGLFSACSKDEDATVVIAPSDGSELTLDGGGGTGSPKTVYVDMSTDSATAVSRIAWSLGFYSGSDYRVILNSFTAMSAVATTKTDISAVTTEDASGVSLAIGQGQGTLSMIDNVYGELSGTVIAEVSATAEANLVYLVKPETASVSDPATWYKVKITRNGTTGYTLQYALLGAGTVNSVTITKNSSYNFVFFSLESGATVNVEPKKAEWDFGWSYAAYYTATIPYFFSDFVVINQQGGVAAAKVDSTTVGYSGFKKADTASLTFSAKRDAIGSSWRSTGTGIYKQYYYVVRDPAGNYYKLKFVSMGINDGGERGYPVVEYALIKE
ncbi:HmuY family protein [Chitinophaga sancti]|uniref:HmuY family protein n=1 Tax=Chitinophaga sancti TaxID=1004 RepID=A0A1K1PHM1_9BACT|nr:HmuY family protein [Chitinophaga sancti]WQD65926.1 HmuY family protein [Chitinophaga sancti]WQG88452.1 HmuY family protein [Chitinophaga sancti]SFW47111.1 HmuY protein [Chitinophaga sancti]